MSAHFREPTLRAAAICAGLCALLAVLSGCGQATPGEPVANAREAIAFGQPSGSEDDATVVVWGNAGTVIRRCTGSLIAPNVVLTARHCVAYLQEDTFSCTPNGDLTPGSAGGTEGAVLAASAITVRVRKNVNGPADAIGTQIFAAQATSICRNDIAVVVLDRALTGLPIAPLRPFSGDQPGETVRLVGYGFDENSNYGTRLSHSGLVISMVGTSSFRPNGDAVPARTFVTEGPAGCEGDSGGPAFSDRNEVLGVFSSFVGTCTDAATRNFYSEVAPFYEELLQPAFAAANAQPLILDAGEAGAGNAASADTDAGAVDPDAGSAGAPSEGTLDGGAGSAPDYHLQDTSGGCKCRMGAGGAHAPDSLSALAAFGLLVWRGRSRRRRAR
jgi:Trypsin